MDFAQQPLKENDQVIVAAVFGGEARLMKATVLGVDKQGRIAVRYSTGRTGIKDYNQVYRIGGNS